MILIISNEMDLSTDEVCQWLYLKKANYFRLNSQDHVVIKEIVIQDEKEVDFILSIKDKGEVKLSEIKSYWYRRGSIRPKYGYLNFSNDKDLIINQYQKFITNDSKSYEYFFHYILKERKKGVGFYFDNNTNKLLNLYFAKKLNLKIPNTFISQLRKSNLDFFKKTGPTIIKTNDTPFVIEFKGNSYTMPTSKIEIKNMLNFNSEVSLPAIVQNQIDKAFELRIFYFDGVFFSSAIFSQQNPKTEVDFRNYDFDKPNRIVPYQLPHEIELKLTKLMEKLKMTTGSIDMIYTKSGDYVFLEINPVGQFQQVSSPCEYYIEKYIAEYLIKISHE